MADKLDLTESEQTAMIDVQRELKHANRAYGALLKFHREIGRTMERLEEVTDELEAAGYDNFANEIREQHLSAGVIDDRWSYETVAEFETGFLQDIDDCASGSRRGVGYTDYHVQYAGRYKGVSPSIIERSSRNNIIARLYEM